jgi:RNA polymerase sigma-70 factor (sigma-E family)
MAVPFDEFVLNRMERVLRFAAVLTGDRYLAEEVVQDVLLKAHRRWASIGELDQPEAYVRRMVVNEYISWRRKWSRIVPSPDIAERADLPHAPDHAEHVANRSDVADRLRLLAPRQRAVIVLRYYQDLPDADIAETLGCSVSAVRSYASRALATMRIDQAAAELAGDWHSETPPQRPTQEGRAR